MYHADSCAHTTVYYPLKLLIDEYMNLGLRSSIPSIILFIRRQALFSSILGLTLPFVTEYR